MKILFVICILVLFILSGAKCDDDYSSCKLDCEHICMEEKGLSYGTFDQTIEWRQARMDCSKECLHICA